MSIELIASKCKNKKFFDEIDFNNNIYCKFRSRFYSIDQDKYLVFASHKWGYGNWKEVKLGIKREDSFEFDHYFKSRTESELNKRMASLLKVIKAEVDHDRKKEANRRDDEESESEENKPVNSKIEQVLGGELSENSRVDSLVEEVIIENISSDGCKSTSKSKKAANGDKKEKLNSKPAGKKLQNGEQSTTSQLKKRKPEVVPHDQAAKPQPKQLEIDETSKEINKQQTISSFFNPAAN